MTMKQRINKLISEALMEEHPFKTKEQYDRTQLVSKMGEDVMKKIHSILGRSNTSNMVWVRDNKGYSYSVGTDSPWYIPSKKNPGKFDIGIPILYNSGYLEIQSATNDVKKLIDSWDPNTMKVELMNKYNIPKDSVSSFSIYFKELTD